jgi:hypothetical protein
MAMRHCHELSASRHASDARRSCAAAFRRFRQPEASAATMPLRFSAFELLIAEEGATPLAPHYSDFAAISASFRHTG